MKKIENKIKDSIQIPNLSFFENLPKMEKIKQNHYVLQIASLLILFVIIIGSINVNKSLSNQVVENNIIFNTLNNLHDNKLNISDINRNDYIQAELMYGYISEKITLEEANKYYNINMSSNNLISCTYTTYNNDQNTILDVQLGYNINNKNIIIRISDNFKTWNIQTNGLLNNLYKGTKSIIDNKQIIVAKYENNDYPKYIIYEYQHDYYHALYKNNGLYYYVTGNNMTEEEFIQLLKEYIL